MDIKRLMKAANDSGIEFYVSSAMGAPTHFDSGNFSSIIKLVEKVESYQLEEITRLRAENAALEAENVEPSVWHIEAINPDRSGFFFDKSCAIEHQSDHGGEITEYYTAPLTTNAENAALKEQVRVLREALIKCRAHIGDPANFDCYGTDRELAEFLQQVKRDEDAAIECADEALKATEGGV